jgi:lysozyme
METGVNIEFDRQPASKSSDSHTVAAKLLDDSKAGEVPDKAATAQGEQAIPGLALDDNLNVDPRAKRRAVERQHFTRMYHNDNFELDAFRPGWGPFQVLSQMVNDGKITMTPEQTLFESVRIRDRDFKEMGRNYYTSEDHPRRWSDREIEKNVEVVVNRAKGIDVSAFQDSIDWQQVKAAGYQFAFLKATEGGDWVDPNFATYRDGALKAGLAVGYYHFFRPATPVETQIKNFVNTVGKADPGSLRLVIDVEEPDRWKPYTVQQRVKMIDDWCQGVKKILGETPQICVYGSPKFVDEVLGNSPLLAKYGLWIAHYDVAEPNVPKPWSKWDFWQYTSKGTVPGINGNIDVDMYRDADLRMIRQRPGR